LQYNCPLESSQDASPRSRLQHSQRITRWPTMIAGLLPGLSSPYHTPARFPQLGSCRSLRIGRFLQPQGWTVNEIPSTPDRGMKSEDADQPDHTLATVTATPAGRWSALAGQSTRLHRRADIPSPSRKRSWNRCLQGAGAPPAIARTAARGSMRRASTWVRRRSAMDTPRALC